MQQRVTYQPSGCLVQHRRREAAVHDATVAADVSGGGNERVEGLGNI